MNHENHLHSSDPGPSCPADQRLRSVEQKLEELYTWLRTRAELPAPACDEHHFATNHRLQLDGQTLWVDAACVGLDRQEAILVAMLMKHALESGSGFMTMQEILDRIEVRFPSAWPVPIKKEVHDAVHTLRRKLGPSHRLVETGKPKGTGYRLSTPPENLSKPRGGLPGQPGRAA